MLVGEDLLVPRTEIAHDLMMHRFDMAMQVRPAKTGHITARVRTVIPQEKNRVFKYLLLVIVYA